MRQNVLFYSKYMESTKNKMTKFRQNNQAVKAVAILDVIFLLTHLRQMFNISRNQVVSSFALTVGKIFRCKFITCVEDQLHVLDLTQFKRL